MLKNIANFICLLGCFGLPVSNACAQFLPAQNIAGTDISLINLQSVDLNADGYSDLVGMRLDYLALLWYLNDGQGHFAASPDSFLLNERAFNPNFADYNADGLLDFAFSDYDNGQKLVWYAGDGLGHFIKSPFEYPITTPSYNFWTVDMDHDGDQDWVVQKYYYPQNIDYYQWLPNDGTGNFGNAITIATFNHDLTDILFAYVNQDSFPDVLIPGLHSWFLSYDTASTFFQKPMPAGVENMFGLADVNNDGGVDLVGYGANQQLVIFKNTLGQFGGFSSPVDAATIQTGFLNGAVGDYDGDGDADVLYGGEYGDGWFENNGTGQFTDHIATSFRSNWGDGSTTSGHQDLNQDGREEALFLNSGRVIQISVPDVETIHNELIAPDFGFASAIKLFDFDEDGDLDLLAFDPFDYKLVWFPNDGKGNFGSKQLILHTDGLTPQALQLADYDQDGDLDIFMQFYYYITVVRNLGFGAYAAPLSLQLSYAQYLLIGDFDGDGDQDLIGGAPMSLRKNLGNGNYTAPIPLNNCNKGVSAATDLDGDGDLDLADVCGSEINILQNDGAANFTSIQTIQTGSNVNVCRWADLNGSGRAGLVTASDSSVNWFPRLPDGSLGTMTTVCALGVGQEIQWNLTDFDGDGDIDIVLQTGLLLYQIKNKGAGTFSAPIQVTEFYGYSLIAAGDLDGDHDADLVAPFMGRLDWLENAASESYIAGRCYEDQNENGSYDPGEQVFRNQRIALQPAALTTFTDEDGSYRIYADSGQYTLMVSPDSCWVLSSDSAAFHLNFNGKNSYTGFDFGLKPVGTTPELKTQIASAATRCGFQTPFWINLRNDGCTQAAARVELHFDTLCTFVSANPAPNFVQPGLLIWTNTDKLQPGDWSALQLVFKIAGPDFLGDTTRLYAITRTLDANGMATNAVDSTQYHSVINCAYDPNDKLVDRTELPPGYTVADAQLIYTVRFQNTGTDTAFNIVLRDRITPEINLATFRPLGASHPVRIAIDSITRTVLFTFENIQLADSTTNERASHGFVQFAITPIAALEPGTEIKNQAGIYFDFNPPIVTNTAVTQVRQISATMEPNAGANEALKLWPNPVADVLWLSWEQALPQTGGRLLIYGIDGKNSLEYALPAGAMRAQADLNTLPAGMYFVKLAVAGRRIEIQKLVRQSRN